MTKKELLNGIRQRIAQGESKQDIYNQYVWTEWESAVTRFLPTQVSMRSRSKWRWLNNLLLVCLVLVTALKLVDAFCLTSNLESVTARCAIIVFAAAVNIALIVAIARFCGAAYLIAIGLTLKGISSILESMAKISLSFDLAAVIFVSNAVLVVFSLVLMLILYKVLLPNSNVLLQPKRDATGKPRFDD